MQTLIASLLNGTQEYQDGGVVITKPPTLVALRAARELTAVCNINATNQIAIMQMQSRIEQQLNEILTLQEQLNEHGNTIGTLTAELQGLRNDPRYTWEEITVDVGSSIGEPDPSDPDGTGCGTN